MKVNVGSLREAKINSVRECIKDIDFLNMAEVVGVEVDSGVSNHPKSMDETIQGAINRAKNSFKDCDLSFGMESGLIEVPKTKSGFMLTTCCAIFDGKDVHIGLSSSFELPKKIMEHIHLGFEARYAFHKEGLVKDEEYFERVEGAIGVLSKCKMTRIDIHNQSVINALIHLENKELY